MEQVVGIFRFEIYVLACRVSSSSGVGYQRGVGGRLLEQILGCLRLCVRMTSLSLKSNLGE